MGILANNENTTVLRSKTSSENGTKKEVFNENSIKTPLHNKDKDCSKAGQATQRRRRAFGDISNRKAIGAAGGGKGGAALKQNAPNDTTQGFLKPINSKVLQSRTTQVKFSKTPSVKRGRSGLNSAGSKSEQRTSSTEYDGVFGVTTRWSNADIAEEGRSLFDLVPENELKLLSDFRDEMMERRTKESFKRDRLELGRCEEHLLDQIREFHEVNEKDIEKMGTMAATLGIYGEKNKELDFVNQKLPWEEEDEIFDSSEERCSPGCMELCGS